MPAQKEQQKVFQSMNDYLEQISKKVCRIEDAVVNDVEKRLEDRRAQKLRDDEQKKQREALEQIAKNSGGKTGSEKETKKSDFRWKTLLGSVAGIAGLATILSKWDNLFSGDKDKTRSKDSLLYWNTNWKKDFDKTLEDFGKGNFSNENIQKMISDIGDPSTDLGKVPMMSLKIPGAIKNAMDQGNRLKTWGGQKLDNIKNTAKNILQDRKDLKETRENNRKAEKIQLEKQKLERDKRKAEIKAHKENQKRIKEQMKAEKLDNEQKQKDAKNREKAERQARKEDRTKNATRNQSRLVNINKIQGKPPSTVTHDVSKAQRHAEGKPTQTKFDKTATAARTKAENNVRNAIKALGKARTAFVATPGPPQIKAFVSAAVAIASIGLPLLQSTEAGAAWIDSIGYEEGEIDTYVLNYFKDQVARGLSNAKNITSGGPTKEAGEVPITSENPLRPSTDAATLRQMQPKKKPGLLDRLKNFLFGGREGQGAERISGNVEKMIGLNPEMADLIHISGAAFSARGKTQRITSGFRNEAAQRKAMENQRKNNPAQYKRNYSLGGTLTPSSTSTATWMSKRLSKHQHGNAIDIAYPEGYNTVEQHALVDEINQGMMAKGLSGRAVHEIDHIHLGMGATPSLAQAKEYEKRFNAWKRNDTGQNLSSLHKEGAMSQTGTPPIAVIDNSVSTTSSPPSPPMLIMNQLVRSKQYTT
jgi:hypothetical protein